jgi:phenylacetate-coenzyme A ligase PaaK-like adenylate-forming protein
MSVTESQSVPRLSEEIHARQVRRPPAAKGTELDTLETALTSVPAYRSWREFDPGPDQDIDRRYSRMPALNKSDIRTLGVRAFAPENQGLEAGIASGRIEYVKTSGSTDEQVTNLWCQEWWNASERASWQSHDSAAQFLTGFQPEAILTSPLCAGMPCETGFLPFEKRRLDRFLFLNEKVDPSEWTDGHMDRMVDELNRFQPVSLEANPSFLAKLSRHIVRARRRVVQPRVIILTYEYPSILHYRFIREAFSAPVASSYGCTECGYVFMECEAGRLHQNTEYCRVDFQPFAEEHGGPEVGRILVTTFHNPWYVMVRFDVGDLVRLEPGGVCPCGRSGGITLAAIEGRVRNVTMTPGGRAVTQRQVDRAISGVPGIEEYQVRQTGRADYEASIVCVPSSSRSTCEELVAEALGSVYGASAKVSVKTEPALSPEMPGKYRLVKPLIPIDTDPFFECQPDSVGPRSAQEAGTNS